MRLNSQTTPLGEVEGENQARIGARIGVDYCVCAKMRTVDGVCSMSVGERVSFGTERWKGLGENGFDDEARKDKR